MIVFSNHCIAVWPHIAEKQNCTATSYDRQGFSCGFECDDNSDMTMILSSLMDKKFNWTGDLNVIIVFSVIFQ